jgi:hypothetical protein
VDFTKGSPNVSKGELLAGEYVVRSAVGFVRARVRGSNLQLLLAALARIPLRELYYIYLSLSIDA